MKKLLVFLLAAGFVLASSELFAQSADTVMRPGVAFVKQGRDTLFMKYPNPDSAVQVIDLRSVITKLTGGIVTIDSVRQLAIIGMDTNDHYLLLAGLFGYLDPNSGGHITYQGLIAVPWPLSTFSLTHSVLYLLPARQAADFHPEGVMSPDGSQWWVVMSSSASLGATDSLIIYHGHTTGGTVDSTSAFYMPEGVQMSNLAVDTKSGLAYIMAIDAVSSKQQNVDSKAYLFYWSAGNGNDMQSTEFSSGLVTIDNGNPEIDNLFGLTVIPLNDGSPHVLLGLTNDPSTNSINLFPVTHDNGSTFGFSSPTYSISRGTIPTAQNFFSGPNCNNLGYEECPIGAGFGQYANAGDVYVNSVGGDSVLFVTHESDNNCDDRFANSAIYYYDYTSGAQSATLVYNDPNAQELQPVWVYMPYAIPAAVNYPGIAWQGTPNGNFGTVDTSKDSAVSLSFTITDTAQVSTKIDSAHITGVNANEFTLTPITPGPISAGTNQALNVTFAPTGAAGVRNATLTVYFEGANAEGTQQETLTQSLSGTAKVDQPNSVADYPALSASMTVDPNPFTSSATVQLISPESGPLGIVVHDALGRELYRSDVRETGAGQTELFTFDAKSLGLTEGLYYVTAFLGDRQASRAVVFIK